MKQAALLMRKAVVSFGWGPKRHLNAQFGVSAKPSYKKWYELSLAERKLFILRFIVQYEDLYPQSKTNRALQKLSFTTISEKFLDSPCLFGIFYNEIWQNAAAANAVATNDKFDKRFNHPFFYKLLIAKMDH